MGPVNTENQYTDQKRDDTGLYYYYGARYYDPALGTFVSPDTIVPNTEHVFGYNRFMYSSGTVALSALDCPLAQPSSIGITTRPGKICRHL